MKKFYIIFFAYLLLSFSSVFAEDVAKINEQYYSSVQEAIDAAQDGDEIVIVGDETVAYEDQNRIYASVNGKNLTIDLNGHTWTNRLFIDNADVTLKDDAGGGKFIPPFKPNNVWQLNFITVRSGSKLRILSGEYGGPDTGTTTLTVENGGTVFIDGGIVRGNGYSFNGSSVIYVNSGSNVTVNDGKIFGLDSVIKIRNSNLTINGGCIYVSRSYTYGTYTLNVTDTSNVSINDGFISCSAYVNGNNNNRCLHYDETSMVQISGATFEGQNPSSDILADNHISLKHYGANLYTVVPGSALPEAREGLVYNGEDQDLITPVGISNGEYTYALGSGTTSAPSVNIFSTDIPQGADAGDYYVWYTKTGAWLNQQTEMTDFIVDPAIPVSIAPLTVIGENLVITESEDSFIYNGSAVEPEFVFYDDSGDPISDDQFTVTYTDNIDAGTGKISIAPITGGNYVFEPFTKEFTIKPREVTVSITGSFSTDPYDGLPHTVNGYTAQSDSELYNVSDNIRYNGITSVTRKDAGTLYMELDAEKFENMNPNFSPVTFVIAADGYQTISPIPVTVTITGASDTTAYDGKGHSVSGYTASANSPLYDVVADIRFSGEASASRGIVGKSMMGLVNSQFTNTNSNFDPVTFNLTDGYQEISKLTGVVVKITGHSNTAVYDGMDHTVNGYDVEINNALYSTSDFIMTGSASATQKEIGTKIMGLTSGSFTNNNQNFESVIFDVTDGYQEITAAENVIVTISGHHQVFDYDGQEHTVTGYDVEISNPLYKVSDFSFTGTQEAKRTTAGTSNMGLVPSQFGNNNTNFSNVTFRVMDGYVTVNKINAAVTITGNNNSTNYDGQEHTVTGYTASADSDLYDVPNSFSFSGTQTVSRTEAGTTRMGLKPEQFSNTNPNFDTVTFNVTDGYQTITPIDTVVTITGASSTAPYDGNPHTVTGYTATAQSALYDIERDFVFSGTASATQKNAGMANMGLTSEQFANINRNFGNVTFNVMDGCQTITSIPVTLTITGASGTNVYDGKPHSVSGYSVSASSALYDAGRDLRFSGDASASRSDAGTTNMGLAEEQFTNISGNFSPVTISLTDGYQEITKLTGVTVKITGHSNTAVYDGQEHTVSGYDVEINNSLYQQSDFTFSGSAAATQKEVGTKNMGLSAGQFTNNENNNFENVNFVVTDGYQTITAAENVVVTITGHHTAVDYDGQPHSVSGYDVEISDPLYTTADFTFTGETTTIERTDAGTTNMGLTPGKFTNNNENITVSFKVTDGYVTVNKINATVTIVGANNSTPYDGNEHSVTGYTVTAVPADLYNENSFTFSGNKTAKRTDAGTVYMGLKPEQFSNANGNFNTVTFNVTDGYQTITPINAVVTITGANNSTDYDGAAHTVSGYTATTDQALYNTTNDIAFSGHALASRKNVGKTQMGLAADQFSNKSPNFRTVTFNVTDGYQEIKPIDVTVTVTGNHNTAVYDGKSHTVSGYQLSADNTLCDPETDVWFNGEATASRTNAGKTDMGLTAAQFAGNNANLNITFNVTDGYQEISQRQGVVVKITGHKNTAVYNGLEHSISGYDVEINDSLYKETDFRFSGTATVAQTAVGTANMNLAASQFDNINTNFKDVTFSVTDGYQEITALEDVVVTITGHHEVIDYDGTEHTVSGYDVEISNPLYKESDFTFSGTAEAKLTNAGSVNMNLTKDMFTNTSSNFTNVTFNVTDGYVTINKINATVTIVGESSAVDYDGVEHSVTGYTAAAVPADLYDVTNSFTFSGSKTAVRTDAGTSYMGLKPEQFTNVNPNFNTVSFNVTDGYQTINKIDTVVTITGASNTTDFDGHPHTVNGYTAEANSELYDVSKDFTFSGIAVVTRVEAGKTVMGLSPEQFSNNNTNFRTVTFNVTDGYQEINKIDVLVTVIGNNNTAMYDGQSHTVSGYQISADSELCDIERDVYFSYRATASRTDAGQTDMELAAEQFTGRNPNMNITFEVTDGYQKITPRTGVVVTITGHTNTTVYDEMEHSVSGYDVEISDSLYEEGFFKFSGNATAARTDAGKTGMGLTAEQFENLNGNFADVTFAVTDGFQEISKLGEIVVTIIGHHTAADYDGTEHSISGYDVEINNPLYKVSDFSFSGDAEAARTDAGTTAMGLVPEQFENSNDNFTDVEFRVTDGYVTVNPITATVRIVGSSNSTNYDGMEHRVEGYTATAEPAALYDVTNSFSFSGTAAAARTNAGTSYMGLKAEDFANTNTNFSTVTFNVIDGYQTVKAIEAEVTIIGHHDTVTFDGQEHTVSGYDFTPNTPLYKEGDFVFSGSAEAKRTDSGTTYMNMAADQFGNVSPNFSKVTFTVTDGYLTITSPDTVTVTITGHHKTFSYDGTEHRVSGYDVAISDPLYRESDFSFTGSADIVRTAAGTTMMGLESAQFTNKNKNFDSVIFAVEDGYLTIEKKDIETVSVTVDDDGLVYNGSEIKPAVTVRDAEGNVIPEEEYSVIYAGNVNAGTAGLMVTAKEGGNYTFEPVTKVFIIEPKPLSDSSISVIIEPQDTYTYNGMEHAVTVKVTDSQTGQTLVEGVDYELTEDSVTKAIETGDYVVTVTAEDKAAENGGTAKAITGGNYTARKSAVWHIVKKTYPTPEPYSIDFYPLEGWQLERPCDHCVLPATGFSGNAVQKPLRTVNYAELKMRLMIPSLELETELVTLPFEEDEWVVDGLGDRAGVMEGSANPGKGYSLVAAHNTLSAEEYGPFALISTMQLNERIFVRDADGQMKGFKVYANTLVEPDGFDEIGAIAREEPGSLILVTCENESVKGGYLNRRVVFARPME
ncbi:MAG: class F sortase [Anaerolineaceae bacterium]|nr:class F sortase [Anaerolineaceae bacterium]